MKAVKAATVDEYIASFPTSTQAKLKDIRKAITQTSPEADESISYGIPAYKFQGKPLIYFAGYEGHIGLYATPGGQSAFAEELSVYKQGKGSVQLPINDPVPLALIKRIVQHNMKTISGKAVKRK